MEKPSRLTAMLLSTVMAFGSASSNATSNGAGPDTSAPDIVIQLPRADGTKLNIPVDIDTLGPEGEMTAEFLFQLDLSKLSDKAQWQAKVDAYRRQLLMEQRKYTNPEAKEMIDAAVQSTIKAHLIEVHGWTLERINEAQGIAKAELAKRTPPPAAPTP